MRNAVKAWSPFRVQFKKKSYPWVQLAGHEGEPQAWRLRVYAKTVGVCWTWSTIQDVIHTQVDWKEKKWFQKQHWAFLDRFPTT